jgi:hypothetical protein
VRVGVCGCLWVCACVLSVYVGVCMSVWMGVFIRRRLYNLNDQYRFASMEA